jgi:DNA-binding PadR family transcriptional regulator
VQHVTRDEPELTPGDWAVLGVIAEGPTHGFAVTHVLAKDAALGQIWTVPRPMVYQALKKLIQLRLVREIHTQHSDQGPARTVVSTTPRGRRELARWLSTPVEHVRDARSLLLLKLALLDRAGENLAPLIEAQRRALEPQHLARTRWQADAEGFERVLATWRLVSLEAVLRLLDTIEQNARGTAPGGR